MVVLPSSSVWNIITHEKTTKGKERKKELNKLYVLDEGDQDIDTQDQEEILKSSMPMIIVKEVKNIPLNILNNSFKP